MKTLTDNIIYRYCKFGWGQADFAKYYELSEEGFKTLFDKTFHGKKAKDLWRKISKNSKSSAATTNADTQTATDSTATTATIETTEYAVEERESTVSEKQSTDEEASEDTTSNVSKLEAQRDELVNDICQIERNHANIVSKRNEIFGKLADHKQWIEEYLKLLELHRNEIVELSSQATLYAETMQNLSSEIATKRDQLNGLEDEIALAKRVSILVYDSGEIETVNYNFCDDELTDWQSIFSTIRDYDIADELRGREIKAVAKVIAFTAQLQESNTLYDITFDSEAAQKLYEEYTGNSAK